MLSQANLPPVLKSWEHLYAKNPELQKPTTLPIEECGATFSMAQELTWVDDKHFVVGRWDGSMSIFEFTQSEEKGPLMTKVVNTPACEGVQMITALTKGVFATSNDEKSVVVWKTDQANWYDLRAEQKLEFDKALGVANSGVSFVNSESKVLYFVIGHSNGFVTIWEGKPDGSDLILCGTTDVRSSKPVNPWNIYNVRGLGYLGNDPKNKFQSLVVTGSEDGDLCVVSVPEGKLVSRQVYNPKAQRGINSIAIQDSKLLVANCAVGEEDHNLWLFDVKLDGTIELKCTDSINLRSDSNLAQVFNFDVIWGHSHQGACWFSATEEGLLWMGTIDKNERLTLIGNQPLTAKLGSAIAITANQDLAVAAYNIYEYKLR